MADSIERCVRDMREAARVEGPTGMRDTLLTVAGRLEAVSAIASMAATVPEVDREALVDLIAEQLRGAYHCGRVWHAWSVGTMGEDDFSPVEESDTPAELADEIIAKLAKQAPVAGQPAEPSPAYWAVIAKCGEGVLFKEQADAQWTLTGRGAGSDGFGVPTIGDAFRDTYDAEQDDFKLVRVQIVPDAAPKGDSNG